MGQFFCSQWKAGDCSEGADPSYNRVTNEGQKLPKMAQACLRTPNKEIDRSDEMTAGYGKITHYLPRSVTVAQEILALFVLVRIQAG